MTRGEKIKDIIKNKSKLIALKKADLQKSKSLNKVYVKPDFSNKSLIDKSNLPKDTETEIYRTIIANTYNYMDSHDDVHLKGIFVKSINETKEIFLLIDHEFKISAQTGKVLRAYEKDISWKDAGLDRDGETTALLLDVRIDKTKNESVFNRYKNDEIDQHSVGMYYVKIELAADSEYDVEAKELYNKYLPTLGNKEKAEEQGYFFVVYEAKLRETSAVLMGSNDLTGVFDSNKSDLEIVEELNKFLDSVEDEEIFRNICKQFAERLKEQPPQSTETKSIGKSNIFKHLNRR